MKKPESLLKIFSFVLILSLLASCDPLDIRRNSNLEDSLLYYKIQMGRSNFRGAANFRMPDSKWDVSGLDRFQLTHYEVQTSDPSDDGNKVERRVLLRYINRNTMRELSTHYTEIWVYNSESNQWLLEGDPPVFR